MFRVALTGGIASGKTTVSDLFAELGVEVIDTDIIARELVAPDTPLLAEMVQEFGEHIIDDTGNLDRAKMRRQIFSDDRQRQRLEAILHPRIMNQAENRAQRASGRYCLVVIPLLVETGLKDWAEHVLVVDVPRAVQIERVMRRDDLPRTEAEKMLDAQASREQRLAVADDVICNDGDPSDLPPRVANLHDKYSRLAAQQLRAEHDESPPKHKQR